MPSWNRDLGVRTNRLHIRASEGSEPSRAFALLLQLAEAVVVVVVVVVVVAEAGATMGRHTLKDICQAYINVWCRYCGGTECGRICSGSGIKALQHRNSLGE